MSAPNHQHEARDDGYDDWLDAVNAGDAYYLECPNGHGSLPPRRVCPQCGVADLAAEPLPDTGTVETVTVVHIATPRLADDAPYATVIADFGPVRVTGMTRGVDPSEVEVGTSVAPAVGESETTGERVLLLEPR